MWSPIAQKITALYFFPWFVLHFRVKTYGKNRRLRDASLISLFGKTKDFFCLSFNNRLQKAPPSFFAYVLTGKRSANQRKKIQGCDFLLNRTTHAKIQLIWTTKKNRPKFDIEWLCCDVFNWFMLSMQILSYGCMQEVWRAREKHNSCSRCSREQL